MLKLESIKSDQLKPPLRRAKHVVEADLRLGGLKAPPGMAAGEYFAECDSATLSRGKDTIISLTLRVTDGRFDQVELAMWITASKEGKPVSRIGRYAKACEIALGRPLEDDDPINEPAKIFAGKKFVVLAGFRKSENPKGGRTSDEFALRRKDDADFLRVHELIRLEDF